MPAPPALSALAAPLYLLRGLRLLGRPGIRPFVLIPFALNVAIFGGLGWLLTGVVSDWIEAFEPFGRWSDVAVLDWLRTLVAWVVSLVIWVLLAYVFTLVANIVGAPFNGLLAERVEAHLTGRPPPPGETLRQLVGSIPRMLRSEIAKFAYIALRLVPLLLLQFVPGVNVIAPWLLFAFGAWVFALEYLDYPLGNHGAHFADVRRTAGKRRLSALGFGATVAAVSAVPIVNLIVMPAAVAGATALWLDRWEREP